MTEKYLRVPPSARTIRREPRSRMEVTVSVWFAQGTEYVVAYCPELQLSSYGISLAEARRYFNKALDTFIKKGYEKGTLDKKLRSLGWTLSETPPIQYQPPKLRAEEVFKLQPNVVLVAIETVAIRFMKMITHLTKI